MSVSTAMSVYQPTRLAHILGCVFVFTLCFPGLISLPGGASPGLLAMLGSLAFWYEAARARVQPFDQTARVATAIVLASCSFLVFWSLLSTFGTNLPLRSSRFLATQVSAFAIYYLVRGTVTHPRLTRYLEIVGVTLAATCVLSLAAYSVDPLRDMIFRGTDRAAGLFKNPNQFGMIIATVFPAMTALTLGRRSGRLLNGACLVLLLLGLVASGSKTNLLICMISLVSVLCFHALISYTGVRRIAMVALSFAASGAMAAIGIAALALLNPRALAIMSTFFSSGGEVDSLMTRSFLWDYSLEQFSVDPILGQGAGQRIDIFYREADVSHSHNVLLDYLRSLGAPGSAAIAVILGAVLVANLSTMRLALRATGSATGSRMLCFGLSLSCIAYIVANMSSDSFGPSTSPFFWLMLFLSFAARRLLTLPHGKTQRRPVAAGAELA